MCSLGSSDPFNISFDRPVHQGVCSQSRLDVSTSFERRSKPHLGEGKEVQEGSIRGVLCEPDGHPLCRILKGLGSRSKDGLVGGRKRGEGEEEGVRVA